MKRCKILSIIGGEKLRGITKMRMEMRMDTNVAVLESAEPEAVGVRLKRPRRLASAQVGAHRQTREPTCKTVR